MINGAPHGGDRSITFAGEQRSVPGWAQHTECPSKVCGKLEAQHILEGL